MFCKNTSAQLNFNDPILNLPKYLKEFLDKSWAKPFYEHIFCNINEERFAKLYSDDNASRPNTPVNILIGLLAIKEFFTQTDEELIGSLHFDTRYKYALGTTSYEKQPVSINTLTNFRRRLVEYENRTGEDLLKEEIELLSENIAKVLKVDSSLVRMDSLMVSSSCKKLSRIELVYTVNYNLIKEISKVDSSVLKDEFLEYLKKEHKNETIYRTRNVEVQSKLEFLLQQSIELQAIAFNLGDIIMSTEAFSNLERVIFEQVDVIENTCKAKLSKNISPDSLQNPSDSDATYRKKYKDNVGYVANVAEAINDETGVIRYYDFKPNRYSDSKFADDVIEKMNEEIKSKNQDKIQLIVDGSYYSQDKADAAKEINIEIIPTELVGKKPSDKKIPYSKFIVDKESNMIIQCPNGHIPEESYFSNSSYTAKFDIRICDKCQNKNMCPFKKQKKFNVVRFSEKRYNTDLQREKMNDKEYIELANKRAGVEGIPSVLRRRYDVDTMPVRGLLRSKLWFGFKILAYNIKKLLKSVKATGYSPVFMRIISQLLVNIRGILNVIKMHNQLA